MVTDGWEGVRKRFARVLGRGEEKETEAAASRLEKSHGMLAGLSGAALEKAQAEQAIVWRTRLSDLLEHDPDADGALRALVAEVEAQVIGTSGAVTSRWLVLIRRGRRSWGRGSETSSAATVSRGPGQ